jgi:hypothetical protein
MALHTVANLRDGVAALLSGVDLNNVDNVNGAFERAARTLVQKADIPEASGTQNITLYGGVINYLCDTRIFGTAINDIRPQGVSRNINDFAYKQPGELFDRTKNFVYNGTSSTFEYMNGVPIIRIVSKLPQAQVIIDPMTQVGNWVAGGTASNLALDYTAYYQSPASLRLTQATGTGTVTETLNNAIDLSSYEGVGVAFLAIRIPDGATASDLTSVSLKLGSDSSNYSSITKTEGFLGAWIAGDWLLVAFDFSATADTGTPDWENINYVQVTLVTASTMTNFRLGGLWISQPTPAQILYQSAAIFKSGSLPASTAIVNNNDTIILNDPAYNIYEYECALSVLDQTGADESSPTYVKWQRKLDGNGNTDIGLYARFRGDNPSEELRTVGSYYDNESSYKAN